MVDETIEQFEERVLNKRAAQLFISVRTKLQKNESIFLSEMTFRNSKKQVSFSIFAKKFHLNINFYLEIFRLHRNSTHFWC